MTQNGRIKGEAKKALRNVIERYELPVTITAQQNLILRNIDPSWKADVASSLKAAGIQDVSEWDPIEHRSMACPALPLCGLAVTEAERSLPTQNERIRAVMNKVGLPKDEFFHVRMTGMCVVGESDNVLVHVVMLSCVYSRVVCVTQQGAPTDVPGPTWRRLGLWALAPTPTSCGWAARPTRLALPRCFWSA